jgi:hypothetical protein
MVPPLKKLTVPVAVEGETVAVNVTLVWYSGVVVEAARVTEDAIGALDTLINAAEEVLAE